MKLLLVGTSGDFTLEVKNLHLVCRGVSVENMHQVYLALEHCTEDELIML